MSSKGFKVHLHREFTKNCVLISPEDLYAVLTLNWMFDAGQSGLPAELVEKIYDDHNGLQVLADQGSGSDDFRIVYVSVGDPEDPVHLLRFISVMNRVTQVAISIYCSRDLYLKVKDYINENIQFVFKKEGRGLRRPVELHYDLVITFGPGALHFIRQGIPVMIIGPYGFGGMVLPENLPYLVRDGFMGRPGGSYGEMIPSGIVQDELLHLKINRPLPAFLQQLRECVSELPFKPLSASGELIERARRLKQQLHDRDARWQLKPRIASNVEIVKKDELSYMKRLYIHDTLAVVNSKKLPFLPYIDAQENCSTLYAKSALSKTDFWKYIYMLWEKKIIVF
jgi:hypothetical protein